MPRITVSSTDSKHILKEKEASYNRNSKQAGVQLSQISIAGISGHSASDDGRHKEDNLNSGTPNSADIVMNTRRCSS